MCLSIGRYPTHKPPHILHVHMVAGVQQDEDWGIMDLLSGLSQWTYAIFGTATTGTLLIGSGTSVWTFAL